MLLEPDELKEILHPLISEGIYLNNEIRFPSVDKAMKAHKFLREAILEREVPITKAIGVEFVLDPSSTSGKEPLSREASIPLEGYSKCGESYPELMVNLQDKVWLTSRYIDYFLGHAEESSDCRMNAPTLEMQVHNHSLYQDKSMPVCLMLKDKVFRNMYNDRLAIKIHVAYGRGLVSLSRNSRRLMSLVPKIASREAFPFQTDYSLAPFIRVLPVRQYTESVPIMCLHGMTGELFRGVLVDWLNFLEDETDEREI